MRVNVNIFVIVLFFIKFLIVEDVEEGFVFLFIWGKKKKKERKKNW